MQFACITRRSEDWQDFRSALEASGHTVSGFADASELAAGIRNGFNPAAAAFDSRDYPDTETLRAGVIKILEVNAFIHTAVSSPLSKKDFHEALEGLGILAQIGDMPTASDAELVLKRLAKIEAASLKAKNR
ncbi:MAG: hypothetical protein PUB69_06160 [Desulfovibrionaceae bacterium]|nr:hypothetical protein [Desulfovibrionaceae bacterium]